MIYKFKKDAGFKILEKYGFKSCETTTDEVWYIKVISKEPKEMIMVSSDRYLAKLGKDDIWYYTGFDVKKYFKQLFEEDLIEEGQNEH